MGDRTAVVRTRFTTRDRAAAEAFIDRMYVAHRPSYRDARIGAEFSVTMATAHGIGCDRVRSSAHVRASVDPLDYLVAAQPVRGRVQVWRGAQDVRLRPGDSALYPLGAPLTVEWDDVDVVVVRLPIARLSELAGELTGLDPAELRFESVLPVSPAMNRYWRSAVGFVNRELLAEDTALADPLLAEETLRMLASAVLSVFPNNALTSDRHGPSGHAAPAALRRAVEFIDSNAHRPIGLTEVARASRVGPRALQQGFARHFDTTPIGYLRRVRLERAHRELQAADPASGATVSAIAARWGFGKPGRFAADYRQRYGQPPSRTLRS